LRLRVDGYILRVAEASPVELDWLRSFLTWEAHDGSRTTVVREGEDGAYTYTHLLGEIRSRAGEFVELVVEGEPERGEPADVKVDPNCLKGITLYKHQQLGVKKAIRGKIGMLSLATAAGKTNILLSIIRHVLGYDLDASGQCFIVVPTMYLAEMIYEEALEKGFTEDEIGVLHGDRKELRPVVVAVSDSIHNSLKRGDKFGKALRKARLMLADEAHHLQSETWREVWWSAGAEYKIGVTATPYNNVAGDPLASKGDAMTLATAGPVLYQVTNEYLIGKGIVAQTYCLYIGLKGRRQFYGISPTKLHDQQIADNEARNQRVLGIVRMARSFGVPVLVFVARTKHARVLMEQLRDEKVICKFKGRDSLQFDEHSGEIEQVPVTLTGPGSWVDRFEDGEWDIVIATQVLDEGVDIPDIGFTVFAGGGKSVRQNIQRRGRGSRRKKIGLNWAFMVDFMDNAHVWLYHHSKKRKAMFEATGTVILEGEDDKFRFWRLVRMAVESRGDGSDQA
jgi:superfamily II DNA or RNA helicase